jgi:AcrR family transcriptional regulator
MPRPPIPDASVLEGARRALDRYGWQGTTLERIAAEAGISRVTLHRRGLTKEGILEQLAAEAVERYRDAMWPVLTSAGAADERLREALSVLCGLAEENLSLLLALDARANAAIFHESDAEEALTRDVFTEPLERLLRDGQNDGTVRDLEPTETATVLFNLVGWTYIHLRTGHRWRPERASSATVSVALRGVAAPA